VEKLRRSTNIELSYMMSKKTLLSVNGRGTLNAQHLFNKNTHVTIEGLVYPLALPSIVT
jgi:hypothetical protein